MSAPKEQNKQHKTAEINEMNQIEHSGHVLIVCEVSGNIEQASLNSHFDQNWCHSCHLGHILNRIITIPKV